MKTLITRQFIVDKFTKKSKKQKLPIGPVIIGVIFVILCLIFVPFPISLVPIVVVGVIALSIYMKWKGMLKEIEQTRKELDPSKCYVRIKAVTAKKLRNYHDDVYLDSTDYELYFEENEYVVVKDEVYKSVEEGHMFYVAYFSENNKPFMCFDADKYDVDSNLMRD